MDLIRAALNGPRAAFILAHALSELYGTLQIPISVGKTKGLGDTGHADCQELYSGIQALDNNHTRPRRAGRNGNMNLLDPLRSCFLLIMYCR